jgi:capsular polysaccharide biosynthesis protein
VDQLQNFSKGPLAETVQRLGLVWVSGVEVYGDTGPNGLADMSLREQMALYRNAAVSLGSVGGGSFGTLFMPRGSTAVRLSSPMVEPTVDWQLFSFMPMTQVKYVKARDPAIRPGSDDANALIADVVTGLRRFAVFHELQVPAFMQQQPD